MKNGLIGSLGAFLAGTGVALAQSPAPARLPLSTGPTLIQPAQTASPMPPVQQPLPATPPRTPGYAPPAGMQGWAGQPGSAAPTQMHGSSTLNGDCDKCQIYEPPFCYPGRFYTSAEYLLAWTKGAKLPPLITTGQQLTLTTTGALGQPGTVVLFGDEAVDSDLRSGGRFTMGYWLNVEQTVGIETSAFFVASEATDFETTSDGSTVLARPFINLDLVNRGLQANLTINPENALLVAFPGLAGFPATSAGTASVSTYNHLWGFEADGRVNVSGNAWYRADLLAGFRYAEVEDDLLISSTQLPFPGTPVVFRTSTGGSPTVTNAASVTVIDSFRTSNEFYGGQLGARIEGRFYNRLTADVLMKLALGVMHQSVMVDGSSTLVTTTGTVTTVPGGLLAVSSNIGNYSRNEFAIVPELGFNVGYQITDHIRTFAGWSLLYFRTNVVRPGNQIDRVVNPSLVPTLNTGLDTKEQQPAFQFVDQDFWMQAINFGVEVCF